MLYIDDTQLDAVLSALGEQLSAAGLDGTRLVVVGGSGLLAIGVVERPTQDVDVVAIVRDGVFVTAEPLPVAVQQAAKLVARDFGLADDWLNGGPTSLLEVGGLPNGFAERVVTRTYGAGLTVDFAGRLDQVHLKLYAYADRREPRDFADLQSLGATQDELHAAAGWARTHNAPGPFDDALRLALRELGVDDVGRVE